MGMLTDLSATRSAIISAANKSTRRFLNSDTAWTQYFFENGVSYSFL